jgi:hypothetical protein
LPLSLSLFYLYSLQIGRFDVKEANPQARKAPFLWPGTENKGGDTPLTVLQAMQLAGLSQRDSFLLVASVGELLRVSQEALEEQARKKAEEEDEELSEFEAQPFVPTTFGARDAIYGAKMGSAGFGSTFLRQVFQPSKKDKALDGEGLAIAQLLRSEAALTSLGSKYAGNQPAFLNDLAEAYLKLTSIGEAYTTRNS